MRLLCFVISIVLFISCEDEVKNCNDQVLADKEKLENEFINLDQSNPDFSNLKQLSESFLSTHKDEKCKLNKVDFHPHAEIRSLVAEIDKVSSTVNAKVIYGDDNRVDVIDYPDQDVQLAASSVAAMIPQNRVNSSGELSGQEIGKKYSLCDDQRFRDQKIIANCTGFLVDDDLLVTAGHCMPDTKLCGDEKWVFGFHGESYQVSPDDIYSCKKVVSVVDSSDSDIDYALIQLDRVVSNRAPLKIRRKGSVSVGESLIIMGHPTGLPLKIADQAQIRSKNNVYFTANLDSFGGNSGSPVLNEQTLEVEGILVRGEDDYINRGECRVVNECADNACDGEESTLISLVQGLDHFRIKGASLDYQSVALVNNLSSPSFPLSVGLKKGYSYSLVGKKFLGACISHIFDQVQGVIIETDGHKCDQGQFQNLYEQFLSLESI